MLNLYELLGVHIKATEPEILVALSRLEYKSEDGNEEVAQAVKKYLLNQEVREMYNQQLLAEFPNLEDEKYVPIDVSILFEVTDHNSLLARLTEENNKLVMTNSTLESQIAKLRAEEKIYRFPVRDRELLDINDRFFYRTFSSPGAKTVFASLLQILINNKRTTKHVIYTESKGFSYARVYEYIILKYKVKGKKKYLLSRFSCDALKEKGLTQVEPATSSDGTIYQSRILVDSNNPMYLEDLAIDHIIQETLSVYDYTIECIQSFNEAVLEIKKQRAEDYQNYKANKKTYLQKMDEQRKQIAKDNLAETIADKKVNGEDRKDTVLMNESVPVDLSIDELYKKQDSLEVGEDGEGESYRDIINNKELTKHLDNYVDPQLPDGLPVAKDPLKPGAKK